MVCALRYLSATAVTHSEQVAFRSRSLGGCIPPREQFPCPCLSHTGPARAPGQSPAPSIARVQTRASSVQGGRQVVPHSHRRPRGRSRRRLAHHPLAPGPRPRRPRCRPHRRPRPLTSTDDASNRVLPGRRGRRNHRRATLRNWSASSSASSPHNGGPSIPQHGGLSRGPWGTGMPIRSYSWV